MRFLMYSGITTIYYREPIVHVFTKIFLIEGTTQKARIIAKLKIIDASISTRMWQELEYRIDVSGANRGLQIQHL